MSMKVARRVLVTMGFIPQVSMEVGGFYRGYYN